jgi:hypothetical protein
VSDERRDYGPAGCLEGCATRSTQLLLLPALLFGVWRLTRRKTR